MLDIAADEIEIFGSTNIDPTYKRKPDGNRIVDGSTFPRSETKGQYDQQLYSELLTKSKHFSRLRPDAVSQFLDERRKYSYLKKFAIQRLDQKIGKKLEILHQMYKYEKYVKEPDEKLSHNIFSWSMEDFLKRRQLHDFVWIDVMQRMSENCLVVYKFKQDVKQLQRFLRCIFDGLYGSLRGFEDVDVKENIVKPISNAKNVLDISKNTDEELQCNSQLLWELSQKDTFMANIKRESADKMMKLLMEARLMNSHIWNPIELRYQLAWYTSKVNQMKYRIDSTQESRQNDISKIQRKTTVESRVNASCMDFYYTAIEAIKGRLTDMQTKFDMEYDAVESRISFKKSRIEKLREEWKFRKEEIQRFREEIEIILRRQKQEAEEKELKRLEEEALKETKTKSDVAKEIKAKGRLRPGSPKRVAKEVKLKGPVKSNEPAKSVSPKKTVKAGKNKK